MFDLSGKDIRSNNVFSNKAMVALRKIAELGKYDQFGNVNPNWRQVIAGNEAIQIAIKALKEIENENAGKPKKRRNRLCICQECGKSWKNVSRCPKCGGKVWIQRDLFEKEVQARITDNG